MLGEFLPDAKRDDLLRNTEVWRLFYFYFPFSLFVMVIASLNLVIDFDFIEEGAEKGAPKYMEWYGAFGLLVTLIWLYLEILRFLAKMRSK